MNKSALLSPAPSLSPAWIASLLALSLCLAVTVFYFVLNGASHSKPTSEPLATSTDAPPHAQPRQLDAMIEKLATRLEKEPGNANGWLMLARSHAAMGRFQQSAAAFARAEKLLPDDASLLADYADVLAMSQQGSFSGKPIELVRRALAIDANNPKALALAATEALARNDPAAARRFWQKAQTAAPPKSEIALAAQKGIAAADAKLVVQAVR